MLISINVVQLWKFLATLTKETTGCSTPITTSVVVNDKHTLEIRHTYPLDSSSEYYFLVLVPGSPGPTSSEVKCL